MKITKRLISLMLCFSMLVGTTFAWFTDTVSSKNNIIVAGNLDVELEYLNESGSWQPITEQTNVFKANTYWEPGHTEVVYLKVSNVGTLALNYKLGVNIVEEVASINVLGDDFTLSTYIMMGAVKGVDSAYANRQAALNALTGVEVDPIATPYAQEGVLYPKNNIPTDIADATDVNYVALVVFMPETVGNEANYIKSSDVDVPTVTLGINVLATQKTYENDSFGDNYDEGANVTAPPVPSSEMTIDEISTIDLFETGRGDGSLTKVTMTIYDFIATDYSDAYPVAEYGEWYCDYFVSTDRPVDEGILLVGNYGTFDWLGFWVPENDQKYEPTGLLGAAVAKGESYLTYEGVCDFVQVFRCGILDVDGKNAGVEVTVDLRMTNPQDSSDIITVRRIKVTL